MTSLTNPRPANRLQPTALLLLAVIALIAAGAQQFVQKRLLQAGIVLFGFQLSLLDIEQVGWRPLVLGALLWVLLLASGGFLCSLF